MANHPHDRVGHLRELRVAVVAKRALPKARSPPGM